jgi:hypothetical protein
MKWESLWKFINLLAIPSSLSRSYSTFPLCSWPTLIAVYIIAVYIYIINFYCYSAEPSTWACHAGCKKFCLPSCKRSCCAAGAQPYHEGMFKDLLNYQDTLPPPPPPPAMPAGMPGPSAAGQCAQGCPQSCAPSCQPRE